jgi:hypothetical protein
MALRAIWQFMDRSVTHKIVYGPSLRSIYYFVGDRPLFLIQNDIVPYAIENSNIFEYYTLRFYFPYLSLLAQPGQYFSIWTGPDQYNCPNCMLMGTVFNIYQIVHCTKGHMAVYGPVCHPQNSIWTFAEVHILFCG